MIRFVIVFLFFFALFFFGINSYRDLTKKEKWDMIKVLVYSLVCSILTIAFLTMIVVLF